MGHVCTRVCPGTGLRVPSHPTQAPPSSALQVANHVVQALLNQKVGVRGARGGGSGGLGRSWLMPPPRPGQDLREECIKLKKRVFDLERQNQALSDLFQQKLQLSAGSLPQVRLRLCQCWGGGGGRVAGQSPLKSLTCRLPPLQLPLHPVPVPLDAPASPQPGIAEQPPPPLPPSRCIPLPEVSTSISKPHCPGVPLSRLWHSPSLSSCYCLFQACGVPKPVVPHFPGPWCPLLYPPPWVRGVPIPEPMILPFPSLSAHGVPLPAPVVTTSPGPWHPPF